MKIYSRVTIVFQEKSEHHVCVTLLTNVITVIRVQNVVWWLEA